MHSRLMKNLFHLKNRFPLANLSHLGFFVCTSLKMAKKCHSPISVFFSFLSLGSYAKILENKEFLLYMTFEVTCQKRHHGEKRVDKNSHLPPQLESLQGIRLVT